MEGTLGFLPLWALFVATVGIALLSVMLGLLAGRSGRRTSEPGDRGPVASVVGVVFGLLAFTLVISYITATANFETRRQLVVDEASSIGSTYSIAGLLPEPQSTELRNILREYVNVRVSGFELRELQHTIIQSQQLQDRLWSEDAAIGNSNPDSVVNAVFVQSLGGLADIAAKRTAAASQHVLPYVWITLYFVAIMAMLALGYQFGLNGKYYLSAVLVLVLAFSSVLWLLADFDRPLSGTLKVSQQPMIDLMQKLTPH